jgi:hypothetical protein
MAAVTRWRAGGMSPRGRGQVGRIVAAFGLSWASRRLVSRRQSHAIDEYGRAIVSLMAFALLWVLVYSRQRSNIGRYSESRRFDDG